MQVSLLIKKIEIGYKFYKIISSLFDDIEGEIKQVYYDMAKIHFISAKMAFEAAATSKKPSIETYSAINHLRDSFNIYKLLLEKRKITRFLFIPTGEKEYLEYGDREEVLGLLLNISTMITMSYLKLREGKAAQDWKKITIEFYDSVCRSKISHESYYKEFYTSTTGMRGSAFYSEETRYRLIFSSKLENEAVTKYEKLKKELVEKLS